MKEYCFYCRDGISHVGHCWFICEGICSSTPIPLDNWDALYDLWEAGHYVMCRECARALGLEALRTSGAFVAVNRKAPFGESISDLEVAG